MILKRGHPWFYVFFEGNKAEDSFKIVEAEYTEELKKFKHSMLSSSNKTKIFRLDDNKTLIFHETLHCNAPSRTTKSGCSKFYLYLNGVNGEIILLKPNYSAIRKLIPKLKKTKLQDCVIKEMQNFVNNPNIKVMNKRDITRIFKKCDANCRKIWR